VRNNYNEPSVTLQETRENPEKLRALFRVFNDTIAFRCEWPEQAALMDFDFMDELTEFVFPAEHTAWWEPV
jgi:alpha-glucosidase